MISRSAHSRICSLLYVALFVIFGATNAHAQDEFPPFVATTQPAKAVATPVQQRIPNPQSEPRAYYDYCTSAAAYWKSRADKAILPVELNFHNTAMNYAASYQSAAASVHQKAFAASATATPRPVDKATTFDSPEILDRKLRDAITPVMASTDQLNDKELVANWMQRISDMRFVTVMHVNMDEAQVESTIWQKLKFDHKRSIGSILAAYFKQKGRAGSGIILDERDGKLLATFDETGKVTEKIASTPNQM